MAHTGASPARRSGILPQRELRTRLYLGFLSRIAVVLVLAGAHVWGIDRLGGQVTGSEATRGGVRHAPQASRATNDIGHQIAQIQTAAKEAASSIHDIGTAVGEIIPRTRDIQT